MALAPLAPWFSAGTPAGTVRAAGVDASGAVWAAVVLGLVAALVALLVLGSGAARPLGAALAVLGAAALLVTLPVVASPPVRLVADTPAGERAFPVRPDHRPAAFAAPLAAAVLLLAGAGLAAPGRRAGDPEPEGEGG